jgi:hypothetical protein
VAKKSRTPPPPRRVQSPKPRPGERTAEDRKRLLVLLGIAGTGFLGLAAALALFAFGGSDTGDATEAIEAAGGTLQVVQAEGIGNHVETAPKRSEYNTWPPSNGPHYPLPPPFDVYDEPVEQFRLVHNLEHGGVVIQYGDEIPQAQIDQLIEWYRDDPNGIVIAPFPELNDEFTLAAWTADVDAGGQVEEGSARGRLARLPRFDEEAFDAFIDAYRAKGPERFPLDQLAPGQ